MVELALKSSFFGSSLFVCTARLFSYRCNLLPVAKPEYSGSGSAPPERDASVLGGIFSTKQCEVNNEHERGGRGTFSNIAARATIDTHTQSHAHSRGRPETLGKNSA